MGESFVKSWLSSFSRPKNSEVEDYLKNSAVDFAKKGISITYLVFGKDDKKSYLLGYYAVTYKILQVSRSNISRTTERRIARFGELDSLSNAYSLPAPLIAQFSKNFADGTPKILTGSELMKLALDQVQNIQHMAGGRIVYLECEDNQFILEFYKKNGFTVFSKRYTDDKDSVVFYHQLLKFLK